MSPRLSLASLPERFPDRVAGPSIDPGGLSIGIVHFGIGAFHRSHQAVFTEDAAAATGDTRWGILGVTGRTDSVVQQLRPQDCLYGVLQKDAASTTLRIIGSVRDVAWPGRNSARVVATLAAPETHIATLTITEKGYLRGADGAIDLTLSAVQADLERVASELASRQDASTSEDAAASQTAIGLLVRGLAARFRRTRAPFTVLSCDNVVHNGQMMRTVVMSFAAAIDSDSRDEFLGWLEASVSFPSSMVDRITPAVTAADQNEALGMLGLVDEALVVAEPFSQWVIEDDFAGPRPAWERAGAILTADVEPFERAKLRILNSTHSLLAYLGLLAGYSTIAEAVGADSLRRTVRRVLDSDILPTLETPPGLDLGQYRDSVLERFANPALAHTTLQVAMDGSQKLPIRFLGAVQDRLDAGVVPTGLALAVAAWILFLAATLAEDGPVLDDPLAGELAAAVGSADAVETEPAAVVERVFGIGSIFPPRLAASRAFQDAVVAELSEVRGLTAALQPSNG